MRNPENRIRNPETRNGNLGFRVLARKPYCHLYRQKPESETQKPNQRSGNSPKFRNYLRIQNLQTLGAEGVSEKPRNPKCFWQFLRNPNSAKPVFTYLQRRNPETQYLPLHYMEGMRYPPWMEWRFRFFGFQSLQFYQQKNLRENERNSKREIQRRSNHRNF